MMNNRPPLKHIILTSHPNTYDQSHIPIRWGPYASWHDPEKIVSLDPYGANISTFFRAEMKHSYDIRPSIALTKAHIELPELRSNLFASSLPQRVSIIYKQSIPMSQFIQQPLMSI